MCGGTMKTDAKQSVAVCQYCGTWQPLPRLDRERVAGLYERAKLLCRGNDFDKAAAVYEQIVSLAPNDAEAYWSLVLCRYGIEYVEDPASHRRVPTINRVQFGSILEDADYLSAIQNADEEQKSVYIAEATPDWTLHQFMDRKRTEGKPCCVYMMAAANKICLMKKHPLCRKRLSSHIRGVCIGMG